MSATEVHSPGRDPAAGTADMDRMSQYTAPTRTIDAPNGTTYAYRRFGRKGATPVPFLQHFRGNLNNWDPAHWGIPDMSKLARLTGITQPTLVANGSNDILVPTVNSHLLAGHIPNAQLTIYPDANHDFLFQYSHEFAAEVNTFFGAA